MTRLAGINRRFVLGGLVSTVALAGMWPVYAKQVIKEIADLKPGEFTWHPERSPNGPVSVVVSLPEQLVHVYRNGVRIAVSTCSTGKPGHETPTGVFVVLQKDKHHHSSTYNNAPMPNTNRLTWSGIALHAGKLPGYPASHGCVRLPLDFSELLFTVTHLGTPVIISGSHSDPWELTHPGMVLGNYTEQEFEQVLAGLAEKKHPSDWREAESFPVTSLVISSADKMVELIENNDVIARTKLILKGSGKLGSHVLVLNGAHHGTKGMHWSAISHHEGGGASSSDDQLVRRLGVEHGFAEIMRKHMHPGMMMILTDLPLEANRRSGKDFVIVTS
ncbi:MAG: L,D-transpeptidase [Rhizobiaceae bacterium]